MSPGSLSFVLLLLLLVFAWQAIFTANRDLARARAWGDLARRALPLVALLLMAGSLIFFSPSQSGLTGPWLVVCAGLICAALLGSVPWKERKANRAFRHKDYSRASKLFAELSEESPLARNHAFLGAALGAEERFEESVESSTRALEIDPEYGLAYYNRALVLLRMNRRRRALKDFQQAVEKDLPRRFKKNIRGRIESLEG